MLVLNDSELLLPAAGKANGMSVIAGTGSIAVGRRADRKMIAAGGWGWYLGDEGSASVVREGARAVRSSLDKGQQLDELGSALMAALGIASPVELGRALSDIGSAADIGSLSHLVFEAADAGSGLAAEVVASGGRALSLLAERLIACGAPESDVVPGGGVMTRQPRLFEAFRGPCAWSAERAADPSHRAAR